MNIKCIVNTLYMKLIKPLYGFKSIMDMNGVSYIGTVSHIDGEQVDGDMTFDMTLIEPKAVAYGGRDWTDIHCEVTPCDAGRLSQVISTISVGMKVSVSGVLAFDPAHTGDTDTDRLEIHPVRSITQIQGSE
jgi:hypothetical protein